MEKLEWLSYHVVKNFEDIFIRFGATHERDRQSDRQTDRQTDGHHVPAIAALCIASHGKNCWVAWRTDVQCTHVVMMMMTVKLVMMIQLMLTLVNELNFTDVSLYSPSVLWGVVCPVITMIIIIIIVVVITCIFIINVLIKMTLNVTRCSCT